MSKKLLILTFTVLLSCTSLFSAEQQNEALLKQISKGFSNVAKHAKPAVVYIEGQGIAKKQQTIQKRGSSENPFDYFNDDFFNRFFGFPDQSPKQQQKPALVRGSGFLVSKDGYIVTNNHVVEKAEKLQVTLSDGKKVIAKIIGTDPQTDLAVIKVEGEDHPFLDFGDSDAIEVGDWAIAIGNPFGLQATLTVGVVSAKGRNQLNIADFEDFIQTDAAINPGNSGGPLLNVESKVIGVNTAIVSGSGGYMGIGFAIPSNMAKLIINQLINDGEVTRGFLGVTLQPIDSDLAKFYHLKKAKGALVTDVIAGSPAEIGGLEQEDVILSYNGHPVENLSSFRNFVALLPPGSDLKVTVNRDGKEKELNLTVSTLPGAILGPTTPLKKLGLEVQELTPEKALKFGYTEDKGVVIARVEPDSPAAEASLRPGSLIIAVNRHKVTNLTEFTTAIRDAAVEGRVLLMVREGETVRFVALHFE
ncbi:MAG: Periplasmic pH-dependent serine endoprotease DegQ [Chlamydiales bacterium]|nr:Periplasmic pH-dependent serine endoprotease DegQ [Chlamydiales bacterium]